MSPFARQSSLAKNINQWLVESTALSPVAQAHRLIQLEKDWLAVLKTSLGPLTHARLQRQAGRIAGLQNGELIVLVDSSATRSKLKLLSIDLAAALRARGWQVSAIRTQVQESVVSVEATSVPNDRKLPEHAAQLIDESANSIGNVKLRQALKRFATAKKTRKP
jgi:hypothetical protein